MDWNHPAIHIAKAVVPCRTLHECVDWNYFFNIKCLFYISRTLHECVDWNRDRFIWKPTSVNVALYTSAWIEMYNVQSVPALLMSHSTRVRGLKYFFSDFIFSISEVALYTSAWIEISTASRPRQRKSSRTLHECVDWNNSVTKADFNSARRTLHECVDWNSEWYWSSKMVRRSHSTRVRGLKYQRVHECIYHFRSHSTRVRGLKYWCWGAECGIDKSHSTRVRGLKLNLLAMVFILAHVALYTSAWIEIGLFKSIFEKRYCRTLHECVDWNTLSTVWFDC